MNKLQSIPKDASMNKLRAAYENYEGKDLDTTAGGEGGSLLISLEGRCDYG
jgi:hypothetical protein